MSDSHAADMAINALNGQELDGRALNVNLAKPKTERSGGGSRDGRSNRW
jgi:RNA recognition motif-containing protein